MSRFLGGGSNSDFTGSCAPVKLALLAREESEEFQPCCLFCRDKGLLKLSNSRQSPGLWEHFISPKERQSQMFFLLRHQRSTLLNVQLETHNSTESCVFRKVYLVSIVSPSCEINKKCTVRVHKRFVQKLTEIVHLPFF